MFNNAMFKWFWTIFLLGAPDIELIYTVTTYEQKIKNCVRSGL